MCCERFKHRLPTQAVYPNLVRHVCVARDSNIGSQHKPFIPILFDMYVLREIQTLAPNTSVYPNLVRHVCGAARDSNIGSQRERLPQSCSTCMCCDSKTGSQHERLPQSCSTCVCCERFKHRLPAQAVYPNLVRHVCVARDSNIGSQHKRLPQSCSTCMCCERFKHCLPSQAFTPILFDILGGCFRPFPACSAPKAPS